MKCVKTIFALLTIFAINAEAINPPAVEYKFDENLKMTSKSITYKNLPIKETGFSIMYWVKPLDYLKNPCSSNWEKVSSRVVVSDGSGYTDGFRSGMAFRGNNKYSPFFSVGRKGGAITFSSPSFVGFDEWACVIWTWDGQKIKGYINGVFIGELKAQTPWIPGKSPLRFGKVGHGMPPLPMYLRNFSFYDYVLNEDDVDALTLDHFPLRKAVRMTEKGEWAKAREAYKVINDGVVENMDYAKIEPRYIPEMAKTKNVLFVSPDGDDLAKGSKGDPLRTWEGALLRVRALRAEGMKGGISVYFRGGKYPMSKTIELTKEDSGSKDFPIVYAAYKNEKPIFSSGFEIDDFEEVVDQDILSRLPTDEARKNIRVCDLKKISFPHANEVRKSLGWGKGGDICVQDLYFNGEYLQLARYPNKDSLHATNIVDKVNFVFKPDSEAGDLSMWAKESHLMACGYWIWCWADFTDKIKVDLKEKTFTVYPKHSNTMQASWNPNVYYFILNALHALDKEGEWYLDSDSGKLYIWPKKSTIPFWKFWKKDTYTLSSMNQTFLKIKDISNIQIWGLTMEYGRGRAVEAKNCTNVIFACNRILNFGGEGFNMQNAKDTIIWGNKFLGFGRAAMEVSGGDRKTIEHSGIRIENNEIGWTSHTQRTYTPGLRLYGCGTKVVYNHFHDILSSAMRLEGNDFLISMNLVERVVTESGDQGGIDIYNNPSYYGNIYSYNIWRKIGNHGHGQAGIRFDDRISGQIVYGNRFQDASDGTYFGGVQINGGQRNIIDNNVFTDCGIGVSIGNYSKKKWIESFKKENSIRMLEKNVNMYKPPYTTKYPGIETLPEVYSQTNRIIRNVFVGKGSFTKLSSQSFIDAHRNWRFNTLPDLDILAKETIFAPLPSESEIGTYK
jgi:hypothetical protein